MTDRSLPRPQEISLASTLKSALDFVEEARRWMSADGLNRGPSSLKAQEAERIEILLAEMERIAGELIARHVLPVAEPELRGLLRSYASVLWANLIDSESVRMRRYGNVPAWYAEEIDPKLKDMQKVANEIFAISREPKKP